MTLKNELVVKRKHTATYLRDCIELSRLGMTAAMIGSAIDFVYDRMDVIDVNLLDGGGERLSQLVELANLSAIIGNLFRGGVVKASNGRFGPNGPHKYPDILGLQPGCQDVEIKVALEDNKPKGHLVKPGPHLTVRYVLGANDGSYARGKRGVVAWIWEVRAGVLREEHFNCSNTAGDSGKTAVFNAAGMQALKVVYGDLDRCPLSASGAAYGELSQLFLQGTLRVRAG